MKWTAATLITLAVAVFGSPTERLAARGCGTPATYRCAASKATIEVCDWDGAWKPLDPGCPSGTSCEDNPYGNNIPYCMAVPVTGGPGGNPGGNPGGSGACTVASQYSCFTDTSGKPGIQICDLSLNLQVVGMCPNSCSYISGIPYCF